MSLIDNIDNSVLFVFFALMGLVLYIFWNMLQKILESRPVSSSDPYDINQIPEGTSDPYANSGQHEDCAICTDRIKYKVELDCRHMFCGKCIMDYYDTLRPSGLKCPLCRKSIRLINAENLARNDGTREFYDKIVMFNHRHLNGANYYVGYFTDFSYLFYRGISSIFTDAYSIFYFIIGLGVVIYYILTPYDIIPDTMGLIGYADDFGVVAAFVIFVLEKFYRRFRDRNEAEFRQIISE